MKNTLLALLLLSISFSSCAQMRIKREKAAQDTAQQISTSGTSNAPAESSRRSIGVAQQFIRDLDNTNLALDIVLSKHVLVQDADDEMYDYLMASLAEIRLNLQSKRLNEIRFVPYADMSRKDVADIDPEGMNTADMIFLYYGKRQLTALYVEKNKIASFTLVSKGNNRAHFVTY
ncbi:hypothetical protein M8998_13230 [Sphingobacterium sp. lm-10]|uniref:hypothetical protein n=1 Tax=Sphingobacterium sp. lm-10 TaxID=2944904 RepID=UPI00202278C7|nr:hypothetical protein [Sphingobacterium sp. lm-10]MCL7988907.1 hypothetical protein [Sphingobacterium sp. lm-10]